MMNNLDILKNALKMIADREQWQPSTKADDYIPTSKSQEDLFYDGYVAGQVAANNDCAEIAKQALYKLSYDECNIVCESKIIQVIDSHTGEFLYFPAS